MRYLFRLIGLWGILLLLIVHQGNKQDVQAIKDSETRIMFSQGHTSPFSAVEKSETNYITVNTTCRTLHQKTGVDRTDHSFAGRSFKLPYQVARITNGFQKSVNLFFIHHFSPSLLKVLRQ